MRFVTALLFFVLLASLGISQSQAQSTPDTLSYNLDTLRVKAVRSVISSEDTPLSLQIENRSQQEVNADASSSLSSFTQNLPGIWVSNRQNRALGERITIRGIGWRAAFGVRGIQLVLDGIPLTVADGQSITNIIDPALITHIELIRGPAASYWGNSSGGVLYLSTKPNYHQKRDFNLRAYGGSYDNRKVIGQFMHNYGNHKISAYTSYHYDGGYRQYSSSKQLRSGVQGSYQFADQSRLEYRGALLWMPQAYHPSGLTATQVDENPRQANQSYIDAQAGKQVTQEQLGLSYYRNTSAGLLTVRGYGIARDLRNPLPFGIITIDRLAGGGRGSLEKEINNITFKGGAELKIQHDDREEFENNSGDRGATTVNQLEKVSNQALFASAKYENGNLHILGSLRFDGITFATDSAGGETTGDRSFHALSPGIGISYEVQTSTLYSHFSTSFEAPTTTELVNRPGGGNGFNPQLKPEHTLSIEAGSRGRLFDNFLTYDVSLYQIWIRDLLFPYQLKPDGATYYRNQGKTLHRGVEVAATLHFRPDFSFQTTYTLTDATFQKAQTLDSLSLKGRSVPGVAEHHISANIRWSPGPFWTTLRGQYVSSYPVDNLNTARNDKYIKMDAKISYRQDFPPSGITVTPFMNLNNIFDVRYNSSVVVNASGGHYYEPAPGRNLRAGISVQF